mmetsp:Transcript_111311/g.311012  ORF Transcript_111311/g.311012 Transcript_111311/m.311012 type:complete len:230 (-) Transcript_111311:718-1407(-)
MRRGGRRLHELDGERLLGAAGEVLRRLHHQHLRLLDKATSAAGQRHQLLHSARANQATLLLHHLMPPSEPCVRRGLHHVRRGVGARARRRGPVGAGPRGVRRHHGRHAGPHRLQHRARGPGRGQDRHACEVRGDEGAELAGERRGVAAAAELRGLGLPGRLFRLPLTLLVLVMAEAAIVPIRATAAGEEAATLASAVRVAGGTHRRVQRTCRWPGCVLDPPHDVNPVVL